MTRRMTDIDLARDPRARTYVKRERVAVRFARVSGVLRSREGANRYQIGDALITGSTGDQWTVSRDRFDMKYAAVSPTQQGEDGVYDNIPQQVLAAQIPEPFSIERSAGGDVISGDAHDWLLQYAPGDYGIVQDEKFRAVYHLR